MVSIARAIVNSPKIILADELTGNLDSKAGHKVGEIMRDFARSQYTAVIIVTHDNRIENVADRTLYLEDGLIQGEKVTKD